MLMEEVSVIAERIAWLDKWKRRHITFARTAMSMDRVKELTSGYSPRDIWNMDETGCFWKTIPEKSLSREWKECLAKSDHCILHKCSW